MGKGGSEIAGEGTVTSGGRHRGGTPIAWPSALAAEALVGKVQTKLHRWAVADRGFRLDDVSNLACDPAVLMTAFERAAGNTGARNPGIDGVRAADVLDSGVMEHLDHIRSQMKALRPADGRDVRPDDLSGWDVPGAPVVAELGHEHQAASAFVEAVGAA